RRLAHRARRAARARAGQLQLRRSRRQWFPDGDPGRFRRLPRGEERLHARPGEAGARHRSRRETRREIPDPVRPAEFRLFVGHDAPAGWHRDQAVGMDRRAFLHHTMIGTAAAVAAGLPLTASTRAAAVRWPIGCFNRPWTTWSFDEALRQIAAAGYTTVGLLTRTKDEPFIGADATPEYLARLERRIAASGLHANMGALRTRHSIPLAESIAEVRRQIDNAATLALAYLLTFGVDKAEEYEHYYKVMADAAAHAEARGIRLVMKPH